MILLGSQALSPGDEKSLTGFRIFFEKEVSPGDAVGAERKGPGRAGFETGLAVGVA